MAETENISHIASKVANDIFRVFHWDAHPQRNANFECVFDHHITEKEKKKITHPADVVFHYLDPYLHQRVYLHTDLKSYKKTSIKQTKIREALKSLAMTVECARASPDWTKKFSAVENEPHDIRGLLFVVNHDGKAQGEFSHYLRGIAKANLPIAKNQLLHILGPVEINRLYAIATDIRLLKEEKKLSERYRFFYPDLTLWKRGTADDQRVAATIETLLSPYFIITHDSIKDEKSGSLIFQAGSIVFYAREGKTVEEFVYLLDSLLRYQLVNSGSQIRIRMSSPERVAEYQNNFLKAKARYCKEWGFDENRQAEIEAITIDAIQTAHHNYSPDEIGWERK